MNKGTRIILGIESSCDETAAAVIRGEGERVQLLSNIVASSAALQAKYGGVIPEQAAREQLKSIIPVINEALRQAQCKHEQIDAIAVTQGPGLIGSLIVGVETAKTLSLIWQKPLIPINHLIAHFYGNWIASQTSVQSSQYVSSEISDVSNQMSDKDMSLNTDSKAILTTDSSIPAFPIIGLLVSGGHTDLILMKDHGVYDHLGGTRDDAAGECFDKAARLLGLPYPGGPNLSKLAQSGNPKAFKLPRPMLDSGDFDFSFSGLKTAVANIVNQNPELNIADLAASVEEALTDVLIKKAVIVAQKYNIEQIMIAGGVAANQALRDKFKKSFHGKFFVPPINLCTDNAATVATAAYFNFQPVDRLSIQANPNLSLTKIEDY